MKAGRSAIVFGGLAVATIGAIALSTSTRRKASTKPPAPIRPIAHVAPDQAAPTTGRADDVLAAADAILFEIPDLTAKQFVLGSASNAAGLAEQGGAEAVSAVYTPDDLAALYLATFAYQNDTAPPVGPTDEDLDAVTDLVVAANLVDAAGQVVIPSGASFWLDQAQLFDRLEDGDRLATVVDAFLARRDRIEA